MKSSQRVKLLCILVIAVTVCSCAAMAPSGPTPEEMIMATLQTFKTGIEQLDIDSIMKAYSEDYSKSGVGSSKADVRAYLNTMIAQGSSGDTIADLEECDVVVDGERATVGPVHYRAPMGVSSWSYWLKRDADGVWRIVDDEQIQ